MYTLITFVVNRTRLRIIFTHEINLLDAFIYMKILEKVVRNYRYDTINGIMQ
jgi:hypothetical protein